MNDLVARLETAEAEALSLKARLRKKNPSKAIEKYKSVNAKLREQAKKTQENIDRLIIEHYEAENESATLKARCEELEKEIEKLQIRFPSVKTREEVSA